MAETNLRYIEIPLHKDQRGSLLAIENDINIPFKSLRSFYLFDVPKGQMRAGHAVDCELFIMALRGSAVLTHKSRLKESDSWPLINDHRGVFVPSYHYIEVSNFTEDALIVVYASKEFEETKYYQLDQL